MLAAFADHLDQKRRAELSQASDQELAEREYPDVYESVGNPMESVTMNISPYERAAMIRGMEISRERMGPLVKAGNAMSDQLNSIANVSAWPSNDIAQLRNAWDAALSTCQKHQPDER